MPHSRGGELVCCLVRAQLMGGMYKHTSVIACRQGHTWPPPCAPPSPTPTQATLPVLQALTGECGFLAANLYARSIFGEDALANLSIERLPGSAEGTPVTGHIRIRAKSQVCVCVRSCVRACVCGCVHPYSTCVCRNVEGERWYS